MESRGRASTVPASSLCPACGRPVDPLRAGHVAILDGSFRYFCDAACKSAHVDALSKRPTLDAMTADPPPVVSVERSVHPPVVASAVRSAEVASGLREQPRAGFDGEDGEDEPYAEEEETDEPRREDDGVPPPPSVREASPPPRRLEENESPSTLRSPSPPELEGAPPPTSRGADAPRLAERLDSAGPAFGVALGVLAAVVSLAGESAAALRLPLALLAVGVLFVCRLSSARRAAEESVPAPLLVLAPVGAASVVALISVVTRHPHAEAHGVFVALSAASALGVDLLLVRAHRDVLALRARTAQALAVTARVVRGEDVVALDASLVKPGEQVIVEAGETVPVDGIVVALEAEVAPWVDSPALVKKAEGDAVVAGAIVASGRLRVNATFSGAERAWLRLTPSGGRPIETSAPFVMLVRRAVERGALLGAALVAGAVYADNGSWLDVAIAACGGGYVLAAACSVSAAALAHARGHVAAQRRGIVYKDANAFEAAARADVAVLCSRGTILRGEPEIVAVEAITKDGPSSEARDVETRTVARVLAVAAGAEISSTHPFASAILREARARGVAADNMRSVLGHSGLGVTALAANGDRVIGGSRAFLLQEKVSVAIADARTSELEAEGRSVLLVAVGGRLVGLLALQDGLRAGARAAVQRLHDSRIEPVLLSGEARDTCETIARALDIEHVRPEILPVDRGAEVRALADGGHIVAALGHASTDDGALGAADVSIAMDAAGAAPGEWGVALASDDVRDAILALTVPRASRDRARVAVVIGGITQAASALAIAFGMAPAAVAPVLGFLATAAVVAVVREPILGSE